MQASLRLSLAGLNVAVLTKVFPTRSHTVAAQGGIGASLGNMSEDNWHYHFYDTVKGTDWLGDQDAIEFMCREAPNVVYELEHFGMPFDRNPDGTIYQRPFGGHTANYGEKPVQRACAAADRTGHAMLHTLYQQNVKARTNFFVEWMALDLIRDAEGAVVGVTALEMETGQLHVLQAKAVMLATGGAGRIFAASTNAFINTGDGLGMAARAGLPLEDMEFWQFHPTGVVRRRRAAHRRLPRRGRDPAQQQRRALHGALRADAEGPRAARLRLALHGPGDQGRARLRPGQGLHRPRHDAPRRRHDQEAPAERARDRPQLRQRRHHARADPGRADDPLPDGRRADQRARPGRRAEGRQPEHGRAGPLRGRRVLVRERARRQPARHQLAARPARLRPRRRQPHRRQPSSPAEAHRPLPAHAHDFTAARLARLDASTGGEYSQAIANDLRKTMQQHAGVFRTQASMDEGVGKVQAIAERAWSMHLADKSKIFNTARVEALEVDNLMESALATMVSAAARRECRGAHTVVRLRAADRRSASRRTGATTPSG